MVRIALRRSPSVTHHVLTLPIRLKLRRFSLRKLLASNSKGEFGHMVLGVLWRALGFGCTGHPKALTVAEAVGARKARIWAVLFENCALRQAGLSIKDVLGLSQARFHGISNLQWALIFLQWVCNLGLMHHLFL